MTHYQTEIAPEHLTKLLGSSEGAESWYRDWLGFRVGRLTDDGKPLKSWQSSYAGKLHLVASGFATVTCSKTYAKSFSKRVGFDEATYFVDPVNSTATFVFGQLPPYKDAKATLQIGGATLQIVCYPGCPTAWEAYADPKTGESLARWLKVPPTDKLVWVKPLFQQVAVIPTEILTALEAQEAAA